MFNYSHNTKLLGWKKYPFSWCTGRGRQFLSGRRGVVQTFAQCAAKCVKTPGCKAIELWHKYNWNCYWCKRTDLIRPYTNTRDLAYPAHVWVQSKKIFHFLVQYLTIRKKQFLRAGGGGGGGVSKEICGTVRLPV